MGLTLDTGAVIALEEAKRSTGSSRRMALRQAIVARPIRVTIPAVVIAEWWQARPGQPWTDTIYTADGDDISMLAALAGFDVKRIRYL